MADYISKYESGAAVDAALDLAMSALQPESGKGLSTNDFTNEYKDKVDSNDAEISSARGSYTTVNERLSGIESEQESQEATLDETRAALAEIVDSGAKNVLSYTEIGTNSSHGSTFTNNGVTFTLNNDGSVTAERTEASTVDSSCNLRIASGSLYIDDFCNGNYILSGCPEGGGYTTYSLRAIRDGYRPTDTGNGVELPDKGANTNIYINILVMATFEGSITFRPMVCSKEFWQVSQTYQPYRPSYQEIYEQVETNKNNISTYNTYLVNGATAITAYTNLNILLTPGIYTCTSSAIAATLTNCPYTSSGFRVDVIQTSSVNFKKQILQPNQMSTDSSRYERSYSTSSDVFSSWYKFESIAVT